MGNIEVMLGGAGGGRGVVGLGGGGGVTLGDRQGGTLGGVGGLRGVGEGSCGLVGCVQLWKRYRSWRMASSWVSITAEGVSFRALERKWRACVIRLARVMVGCVK